jgi:hypothetical protein
MPQPRWAQKQLHQYLLDSYCNIKKGALMILATMIMIWCVWWSKWCRLRIIRGCLVWHPDSYVFLWLPLKCIRIRCLLWSTIALYFSNFVKDSKTPAVVVMITNQKNSLVKEYFLMLDSFLWKTEQLYQLKMS